ncbi:ABC transporter permease [Actinomadura madurae]|uniref:ABC transporter permease n=1 Tax=Actinomadura madurae TaxID=1993 RepID=UPI000D961F6C|nr:ABC transporter permease [Actinomadura madurae]MCP9954169.1 ABC transporter permease [Actinomadura madurae]MCP9970920.1 ABC transporter permease [Actinomadura madurae]MCP9983398.1 ABC transporter permease [Actinomadura madurae]MCQ0019647.1 ABC transporter permease [Actinomadura madurae]URM99658.1 ABC transporter permease [Actinomadura madurae]
MTDTGLDERGGALGPLTKMRPGGGGPWRPFGRNGGAGGREIHHLGLVAALVLLAVVGLVTEPDNFATSGNVVGILALAATIGVITVGQTFVIIGGGIDLSVGSVMALASVWATTVATQSYGSGVMALCAILVGTGSGVVTGLLISYGRLVPFIATLAMLVAARGLAQRMSDRKTQLVRPENDAIEALSTTRLLGLPLVVYIFAAVAIAGWLLLNRTTFGRRTFAVGGNPEAARLAGINVRRHTLLLYALSGFCCGIAAIIIMARTTTGSSTHGDLYELDAIAAVIIGGTLLTGGRGTVVGSILGVLVFTVITNLFILNGLQTSDQLIAKGVIIVIAVLLQRRGLRSPT